MIKSFRHAGLRKFFLTGSKAGIQPNHASILADQLTLLNVAKNPEQMNVPTWGWHPLKGEEAGQYAVWVNRNWDSRSLSMARTPFSWTTEITIRSAQ